MVFDPSVRASYQKLIRDYKRIHDSFATLMFQYAKIQHETIAQFGGEQGWMSPEEVQKQKATKHEVSQSVRPCSTLVFESELSNIPA